MNQCDRAGSELSIGGGGGGGGVRPELLRVGASDCGRVVRLDRPTIRWEAAGGPGREQPGLNQQPQAALGLSLIDRGAAWMLP